MVSLLKLAKITEEGVRFLSPHDGSPMYVLVGLRADTGNDNHVQGYSHQNIQCPSRIRSGRTS